jgi:diguanylate cyclase (GGDEF)-like protein
LQHIHEQRTNHRRLITPRTTAVCSPEVRFFGHEPRNTKRETDWKPAFRWAASWTPFERAATTRALAGRRNSDSTERKSRSVAAPVSANGGYQISKPRFAARVAASASSPVEACVASANAGTQSDIEPRDITEEAADESASKRRNRTLELMPDYPFDHLLHKFDNEPFDARALDAALFIMPRSSRSNASSPSSSLENATPDAGQSEIENDKPSCQRSYDNQYRGKRLRTRLRVRRASSTVGGWLRAAYLRTRELIAHPSADSPIFNARLISEEQREPFYEAELRRLFGQRLRLITTITLMALPVFAFFHSMLAGKTARLVLLPYAAMLVLTLITRLSLQRLHTLKQLRLQSLGAYALFCAGAGLVVTFMPKEQAFIMGGHNHIVLSVLLLPFGVWECLLIGVMAIVSLACSGWFALMPQNSALYFSHLFVLGTTTLFVLAIAHFQALTRRRAFDAAFDVMRSATRLQTLSFLDALTGGFNRRYLEKMLSTEIARAVRFERPLSLLMFDLDNFKIVNDTRGHAAGDEVLREVWQAAMSITREVDTAARYGGDEFCIVLPEADETSACTIAERLRQTAQEHLHQRFGQDALEGKVTLSIGLVTMQPGKEIAAQAFLESADERLYAAKRAGKNHIAF